MVQSMRTLARDQRRRAKAYAILARPNPDRRAVKRANRLLRDAGRDGRVAAQEAWNSALASFGKGAMAFGAELTKASAGMMQAVERISRSMSAVRTIPILPPGDELIFDGGIDPKGSFFGPIPHRNVAIHTPRRMGKTAAMDRYSPAGIERTYRVGDIAGRGYRIFDIDQFEKSLTDEDRERFEKYASRQADEMRQRIEHDALRGVYHRSLGEPYEPAINHRDYAHDDVRRGCRHGIWLYGDSCATCAREDEAKETKQSD